ncbi:MAG: sulfite exporter TauE/SafE family protein [Chloroflexota bacterium]|nr:sulfite exporter TauE/SafE family protein [Chloroflexota bacterium]
MDASGGLGIGLLVNLPTIAVSVVRHIRRGAYAREAQTRTAGPMGLGSVIGDVLGGHLVGSVLAFTLKPGLGIILIVSAWRTFRHT